MSAAADLRVRLALCLTAVLHVPACEEAIAEDAAPGAPGRPTTLSPARPDRVLRCSGDVCTDRVTGCQYLRLSSDDSVAIVPRLRSHGTPWCDFTY